MTAHGRRRLGPCPPLIPHARSFIALGALFFLVVVTNSVLGFGVTRLLGGMAFCLGLANWVFLPFGLALDARGAIPIVGVARNLVAVTAGTIVGGTLLVAGVYWIAYLRVGRRDGSRGAELTK